MDISEIGKEIKDLLYILNDENLKVDTHLNNHENDSGYILYKICRLNKLEFIILEEEEYLLEFLERVNDICESNGWVCSSSNTTPRGKIIILNIIVHKPNLELSSFWIGVNHLIYRNTKKVVNEMKHLKRFTELIKLDIKKGDTILGGRFKNKKVKVKKIGKNSKGDITINDKPLLRFRTIDQDKLDENHTLHGVKGMSQCYDNMVKIVDEINDILFILNDVSIYPDIDVRWKGPDRSWIDINFHCFNDSNNIPEEYWEFLDRVSDISKSFGYETSYCEKIGYILIYDPKKENKMTWGMKLSLMESVTEKNKMLSEIRALEYILSDDNLEVDVTTNEDGIIIKFIPPKEYLEERYIEIRSGKVKKSDFFKNSQEIYRNWLNGLVERESYKEYFDRISEIVESNGCDVENNHSPRIIEIYYNKTSESTRYKSELQKKNEIITKVFYEIDHLKYILEDENIKFTTVVKSNIVNPNWICIHLETENLGTMNQSRFSRTNSHIASKYSPKNKEFIEEYLDRVQEICKENGCELCVYAGYSAIHHRDVIYKNRGKKLNESVKSSIDAITKESIYESGDTSSKRARNYQPFRKQNSDIEKVFKEISDLKYILEDEGILFDVRIVYPSVNPRWICISLETIYGSTERTSTTFARSWQSQFKKENEDYIFEYLDRVREICEQNNCSLNIYGGYCTIRPIPYRVYLKAHNKSSEAKLFNENKFSIENLIKEIGELDYILEDENIQLSPHHLRYHRSGVVTGDYIHIPFYTPIKRWQDILSGGEDGFFIEYLNRVSEIASKYDYILYIQKNYMNIRLVSPHYIHWKDTAKFNIAPQILNQ